MTRCDVLHTEDITSCIYMFLSVVLQYLLSTIPAKKDVEQADNVNVIKDNFRGHATMWNSPRPFQAAMPDSVKAEDGAAEDSTENHLREEQARTNEARLRLALDAAGIGVWYWNIITGERSWSDGCYALFGMDSKQATSEYHDFEAHIHTEDRTGARQAVQHARDTGEEYRHEYRVVWPDGTLHRAAARGRFFHDAAGNATHAAGVLMTAAERPELWLQMEAQMAQAQAAYDELEANRRHLETINAQLALANAQLHELATTDDLTLLKNKRAFLAFLEREYQAAARYDRPLSVILLDADRFKQINDRCGHPAGDAVLRRMGELLQSHTRQTDMAARFGGEEFVYVLPDTDHDGAMTAAERIRVALETFPWQEHPVTASFGVSTGVATTADAADLIAQADRALYHSKRRGRNRVTHFADIA